MLFHEKILLYYVHVSSIGGLGKYLHTSHYGVLTQKMAVRLNCIDEHAYRTDKFLSESVPTTSTISDPTTRFEQAFYCLALARALLAKGELVLADEPTRALDLSLRNQVAEPFIKLRSLGKTVVIVSHDPYFKEISDQVIELK